jgi:hypothetical protein
MTANDMGVIGHGRVPEDEDNNANVRATGII